MSTKLKVICRLLQTKLRRAEGEMSRLAESHKRLANEIAAIDAMLAGRLAGEGAESGAELANAQKFIDIQIGRRRELNRALEAIDGERAAEKRKFGQLLVAKTEIEKMIARNARDAAGRRSG